MLPWEMSCPIRAGKVQSLAGLPMHNFTRRHQAQGSSRPGGQEFSPIVWAWYDMIQPRRVHPPLHLRPSPHITKERMRPMITRLPGLFRISHLFDLFEEGVMLVLTLLIVVIAGVSLVHVVIAVGQMLLGIGMTPTSPEVIQSIFGMFFTVLIALEFKHSILVLPDAQPHSMIRMRSVLLIGMLATVRKFIVLDLKEVNVMEMLALSASILALGIVYWLVRPQMPSTPDDMAHGVPPDMPHDMPRHTDQNTDQHVAQTVSRNIATPE